MGKQPNNIPYRGYTPKKSTNFILQQAKSFSLPKNPSKKNSSRGVKLDINISDQQNIAEKSKLA